MQNLKFLQNNQGDSDECKIEGSERRIFGSKWNGMFNKSENTGTNKSDFASFFQILRLYK